MYIKKRVLIRVSVIQMFALLIPLRDLMIQIFAFEQDLVSVI